MKKILLTLLAVYIFLPCVCQAATVNPNDSGKSGSGGSPVEIKNPIGDQNPDPNKIIGTVISAILSLVGAVALLMIVYGGVLWMFAAGNKENITKGKDIIMWTALGMLLIFSSYAIIRFILDALMGKTG